MIDSSFGVILCYKAQAGKEINDSGGEFPRTVYFISFFYPPAAHPNCAVDSYRSAARLAAQRDAVNQDRLERLAFGGFLVPHA
jgi:hypothetical protein